MIHKTTNLVLLDKLLEKYQERLSTISWLEHIYGKCIRYSKHHDFKPLKFYRYKNIGTVPSWYIGNNEYEYIGPDDRLGNHSFFDIDKGEYDIRQVTPGVFYMEAVVDLIVMFNYDKVFPGDKDDYSIENVKQQVMMALGRGPHFISTAERSERVFSSFTLDEVEQRFMMRPWDAFRIRMKLIEPNLDCNGN